MDKIKLCPFCEKPFEIIATDLNWPNDDVMIKHDAEDMLCPMACDGEQGQMWASREVAIRYLNTRPIENNLVEACKVVIALLEENKGDARWYLRSHYNQLIAAIARAEGETTPAPDAHLEADYEDRVSGNEEG